MGFWKYVWLCYKIILFYALMVLAWFWLLLGTAAFLVMGFIISPLFFYGFLVHPLAWAFLSWDFKEMEKYK